MPLKRTVVSMIGGVWGEEPGEPGEQVPIVRVADFEYDELSVRVPVPTTRTITVAQLRSRELKPGDLLLEKSGGGEKQNVGRVTMWDGEGATCFSNFIARLRPAKGMHPKYLAYLHAHCYAIGVVNTCTKQTTGIQNLDVGAYLATHVEVPKFDRQEEVAEYLDRECEQALAIVDRRRAQLQQAESWLQSRMAETVGSQPRTHRLGQLAAFRSGGTPPKDAEELWIGDYPWASTKDLRVPVLHETEDHITPDAANRFSRIAPKNSILVSTRGMSLAKRLPMSLTARDMAFNQDLKCLEPREAVLPAFLHLSLLASERDLLSLVVDSSHGTKRLATPDLKQYLLPVPTIEKQEELVREWNTIVERITRLRAELSSAIDLTRSYRLSLISEAMAESV